MTYRDVALLVDDANSSTLAKQHVALVVAHELAHQWYIGVNVALVVAHELAHQWYIGVNLALVCCT